MAGGVEQRHAAALKLEFERRGRDRDAALLLQSHPVGRRVSPGLAAADSSRELDRAGVQQELLGQRRLARIGVRDDGERAPSRHFAVEIGVEGCFRQLHAVITVLVATGNRPTSRMGAATIVSIEDRPFGMSNCLTLCEIRVPFHWYFALQGAWRGTPGKNWAPSGLSTPLYRHRTDFSSLNQL